MKRRGILILATGLVLLGAAVACAGSNTDLLWGTEKWFKSSVGDKLATQSMHTLVLGELDGATMVRREIHQNGVLLLRETQLLSDDAGGNVYNHGTVEAGRWSEPILWVAAPLSVGKTWTAHRPYLDGATSPDNQVHYLFGCIETQTITCPAGVYPAMRVFVAAIYPDGSTEFSSYWYNENCGLVMMSLENQRLFVLGKAIRRDLPDPVRPTVDLALDGADAYPNPANPQTDIVFELGRAGLVDVELYDVAGRLVRRLASGLSLGPGPQSLTWDGRNGTGEPAATGVYLFRVRVGTSEQHGRLTLVR